MGRTIQKFHGFSGEDLKAVYTETGSAWQYDEEEDPAPQGRRSSRAGEVERADSQPRARLEPAKADKKRKPNLVGKFAAKQMDGAKLRAAWNDNRCVQGKCKRSEIHACSIIAKENGRVCGMRNHRACDHKFKG